jgi:hypothetical protein
MDEHTTATAAEHRRDVLRRLLDRGVSLSLLELLLPDWQPFATPGSQMIEPPRAEVLRTHRA